MSRLGPVSCASAARAEYPPVALALLSPTGLATIASDPNRLFWMGRGMAWQAALADVSANPRGLWDGVGRSIHGLRIVAPLKQVSRL